MRLYEELPLGADKGADFAVRMDDDSLSPWVKRGELALLERSAELSDGDVGLFHTGEGMAFRQFCRDSRGAAYLLSPDRRCPDDLTIPPERVDELVCYGRLLLSRPIPLPMD